MTFLGTQLNTFPRSTKAKYNFQFLARWFFLQLSEDEYCISCAQIRQEAKLHVMDEYFVPDIFSITLAILFMT